MKSGRPALVHLLNAIFIVSACAFIQVHTVSAEPAVSSGTDFDIPLSELDKVKKRTPSKRSAGSSKKKFLRSVTPAPLPVGITRPDKPSGQAAPSPETEHISSKDTRTPSPVAATVSPKREDIIIQHFPYSFVVSDRKTIIHTVVSSPGIITEVTCTIHGIDKNASSTLKMEKVGGTHYTYSATLPGVPPDSTGLRYTISATDSLGKTTRSREYETPVTPSPVVPDWQIQEETVTNNPVKVNGTDGIKKNEEAEDVGEEETLNDGQGNQKN
ncbi:MAG: hypothetical protein PHY09_07640 [Desulfuromonadaceae bacterium]|nr:hypothetical protein [Desulfuromonadaceae bacterium]MDD5106797.1 hypothetical protein [Desulfuromonadaceae bacterium]